LTRHPKGRNARAKVLYASQKVEATTLKPSDFHETLITLSSLGMVTEVTRGKGPCGETSVPIVIWMSRGLLCCDMTTGEYSFVLVGVAAGRIRTLPCHVHGVVEDQNSCEECLRHLQLSTP